jgi:hypothetical protein
VFTVKGSAKISVPKHCAMKTYREVEVKTPSILTFEKDGVDWLAPDFSSFLPDVL